MILNRRMLHLTSSKSLCKPILSLFAVFYPTKIAASIPHFKVHTRVKQKFSGFFMKYGTFVWYAMFELQS
jgi:hypothetical protein